MILGGDTWKNGVNEDINTGHELLHFPLGCLYHASYTKIHKPCKFIVTKLYGKS